MAPRPRQDLIPLEERSRTMLYYAIVIAILVMVAKVLLFVFAVLFVFSLVFGQNRNAVG